MVPYFRQAKSTCVLSLSPERIVSKRYLDQGKKYVWYLTMDKDATACLGGGKTGGGAIDRPSSWAVLVKPVGAAERTQVPGSGYIWCLAEHVLSALPCDRVAPFRLMVDSMS